MREAHTRSSRSTAELPEHLVQSFDESVASLRETSPILRQQRVVRLLSQVDILTDTAEGLALLRERIAELTEAGLFQDGPWQEPAGLVPSLVPGTLRAGGHSTLLEILSELRMLAIADGELDAGDYPAERAEAFLREVMVHSLDLLFPPEPREGEPTAESGAGTKIGHLARALLEWTPLHRLAEDLATEIELICLQRRIVDDRALRIISLVHGELRLDESREGDRRLARFVEAVYAPSPGARDRTPSAYASHLASASREELEVECRHLAATMEDTGLAVAPHASLVRVVASDLRLLGRALGLTRAGRAELEEHHDFIARLVQETIHPPTARAVYGLARLIDRGLFSHQPVRSGLERIGSIEFHPRVEEAVVTSRPDGDLTARQLLLADCLCVLGQPLGVGQGRNPTCQSARGISLWSRHAPGKLLEMIRTVSQANDLAMRFEGAMIRSSETGEGLLKEGELDQEVDAVSLILVPHLDRIYNEMMRRAGGRLEDPHKWVNPAMYGQWIPNGFLSAYEPATGAIQGYRRFLRTFYATHHPDFNRGHDLAHPNPVGIFLTSSSGALIGFHAVSILRVRPVNGQMRVYLFNPNTEGRQRWHADISPTVAGHGEAPGESSLPFDQFASRLYAFHFNPSDVGALDAVDDATIAGVEAAARESWGRSYQWTPEAETP